MLSIGNLIFVVPTFGAVPGTMAATSRQTWGAGRCCALTPRLSTGMPINVAHGFRHTAERFAVSQLWKLPPAVAGAPWIKTSAQRRRFSGNFLFPRPTRRSELKAAHEVSRGSAGRAGARGRLCGQGRSRPPLPRPCNPRAGTGRGPREEGSAPRLPTSPPRPAGGGESERGPGRAARSGFERALLPCPPPEGKRKGLRGGRRRMIT